MKIPPPTTLALATSQPGSALAPPGSGLSVFDNINKGDIAMAVRVEQEDRLGREQTEANKQLNTLTARLTILNSDIDKLALAATGSVDLDSAEVAAAAINRVFGVKAEAAVELSGRDDERKRFNLTVSITKPASYGSGRDTIGSKAVTVPYTTTAIDLLKEIKLLQREIKNVQATLISIKRDMSNLPALERRAHAELVKVVLSGSKDGQALLTRLRLVAKPAQTIDVIAAA